MNLPLTERCPTFLYCEYRKQALQIAVMFDDDSIRARMEKAFPLLGIVACSGHVIDNPGRAKRFPPEAESIAKEKIEEALERLEQDVSSAACGTDILFLEAMAEEEGNLRFSTLCQGRVY